MEERPLGKGEAVGSIPISGSMANAVWTTSDAWGSDPKTLARASANTSTQPLVAVTLRVFSW